MQSNDAQYAQESSLILLSDLEINEGNDYSLLERGKDCSKQWKVCLKCFDTVHISIF